METWTLSGPRGTRSFAEWGVDATSVRRTLRSLGVSELVFRIPGDADREVEFPYNSIVSVYRNGRCWFAGKVSGVRRVGEPDGETIEYTVSDAWWDLERTVFRQSSNVWNSQAHVAYEEKLVHVFLLHSIDGSPMKTGAQILEALEWARECGVALQASEETVDVGINVVSYEATSVTVAEVIRQMLRWTPDRVSWIDYTTSPPTLYIQPLMKLEELTVQVGAGTLARLDLRPRHDLVLPGVSIQFTQTSLWNGVTYRGVTTQEYPSAAACRQPGAAVHHLELAGAMMTRVESTVRTEVVHPTSPAWWARRVPWLANPHIKPDTVILTWVGCTDESGVAVSLGDYPCELVSGQLADAHGYQQVRATLRARVEYKLYATLDHETNPTQWTHLVMHVKDEELSARVMLTNLNTQGQDRTLHTVQSWIEAEPIPAGLAKAIYDSRATLEYDGELTLLAREIPVEARPGLRLRLSGLREDIQDQLIQQTIEEPHTGRVNLRIGPSDALGLDDLVTLLRQSRSRRFWHNPAMQTSAQMSGHAQVELGRDMPRENTNRGAGVRAVISAVSGPDEGRAVVQADAENKSLALMVSNRDGSVRGEEGQVHIWLNDLKGYAGVNKIARFREVLFKDAFDECRVKRMCVLCTEAEAVPEA